MNGWGGGKDGGVELCLKKLFSEELISKDTVEKQKHITYSKTDQYVLHQLMLMEISITIKSW